MGTFLILWIIFGVVLQVGTLPLAAVIGLRTQWSLAGTVAVALAAYFAFLA